MTKQATFFSDKPRQAAYNLREMRELCALAGLSVFKDSNWLQGLQQDDGFFAKAICVLFRKDDPGLTPEAVEDLIPADRLVEAVTFLASIAAGAEVTLGESPLPQTPSLEPSVGSASA